MKEQGLEAYANKLALEGKSSQEVFDEIALMSDGKLTKIAEVVRKTPTLVKRQQYKNQNSTLCLVLAIIIVIHMLLLFEGGPTNLVLLFREIFLYLLLPGLLLYGVRQYIRNAHLVSGFYCLLCIALATGKVMTMAGVIYLIEGLMAIAGSVLSFYLNSSLSTDYRYNRALHLEHPDLREGVMEFDAE